jgi:hypothetical protein
MLFFRLNLSPCLQIRLKQSDALTMAIPEMLTVTLV